MLGWIAETTVVAALLAGLALGLGRSRRFSAEARHAAWVVVLLKFLLPPLVTWPHPSLGSPPPEPIQPPAVVIDPPAPAVPTVVVNSQPAKSPKPPLARAPIALVEGEPAPGVDAAANLDPAPPPPGPEPMLDSAPISAPPAPPVVTLAPRETDAPVVSDAPPSAPLAPLRGVTPSSPAVRSAPPAAPPAPISAASPLRIDWQALVLGAWGLGSLVVGGRTLVRVVRFRRLLARGRAASASLRAEVALGAERLGIPSPRTVWVVPGSTGPLVWCLGRPVLVLPEGFEHFSPATRSSLLAHELAHLARGDHWVARLELLAGLLWWWNPVFRLARRRGRQAAEAACDARVVRSDPRSRFAYAEALVAASARFRVAPPLPALGIGEAARTLEARLTMILRDPVRPPSRWLRPLAVALVALSLPSWTLARQGPAPDPGPTPPAPTPSPSPTPNANGQPNGDPPGPTPAAAHAPGQPPPPTSPHPLLAAGVPIPQVEWDDDGPWTIEQIVGGVDGRDQPRQSLAFRHTASMQLASQYAFVVGGETNDPGVRVQVADVTLARKGPRADLVNNSQPWNVPHRLGAFARLDLLEAARPPVPGQDGFDSPNQKDSRPDWLRWFAATDDVMAVTLGTTSLAQGPVPIRWLSTPLGSGPPPTDDLSPHFYRAGRNAFGNTPNPGTGPLRVRPETLLDFNGPMLQVFQPQAVANNTTYLTPTRQLVGLETIEGIEVARVAWLANDNDGVHGLAWVAPNLGFAVVRFEATTVPGSSGERTTWRRESSGYRPVGNLWLPDRVEYHAQTRRNGESTQQFDLIGTFEDYRVDTEWPPATFRPKLAIGGLDERSGFFTAEPPPIPDGLVERLQQAVAASPFGPPRIEPPGERGSIGAARIGQGAQGADGEAKKSSNLGGGRPSTPAPEAAVAPDRPTVPAAGEPKATTPAAASQPPAASSPPPSAPTPTPPPSTALKPTTPPADPALVARRATLAIELARAQAEHRLAQSTVARNSALNKKIPNSVAREEIEKAEAGLALAQAEIDRIRAHQAEAELGAGTTTPTVTRPAVAGPTSRAVLQARRAAQAAEVSRVEAGLKLAGTVVDRNAAYNKKIPNSVSREEIEKAEAEAQIARATVDREQARLAELDALLAEATSAVPPAPVLRARRDAQAAEVSRAEVDLRMTATKLDQTRKLRDRNVVSQTEVDLAQGAVDLAQATVDRERAKLAEAEALMAEAPRRPIEPAADSTTPAPTTPSARTLLDLREQAELLDLQIAGQRAEVDLARASVATAARESNEAADRARLDLAGRQSELRQLELRLKQVKARIDAETARVQRLAERAKARLAWSRPMFIKGVLSRAEFQKAQSEYDDLMLQLDPQHQPEPEPKQDPLPASELAPLPPLP